MSLPDVPSLEAHYELGEELGRGGFGVVLRAKHRESGAEAAIKLGTGVGDGGRQCAAPTSLALAYGTRLRRGHSGMGHARRPSRNLGSSVRR